MCISFLHSLVCRAPEPFSICLLCSSPQTKGFSFCCRFFPIGSGYATVIPQCSLSRNMGEYWIVSSGSCFHFSLGFYLMHGFLFSRKPAVAEAAKTNPRWLPADGTASRPTIVQLSTIPLALAGHHVVGQALGGSGKTGAFVISALNAIDPAIKAPQVRRYSFPFFFLFILLSPCTILAFHSFSRLSSWV